MPHKSQKSIDDKQVYEELKMTNDQLVATFFLLHRIKAAKVHFTGGYII